MRKTDQHNEQLGKKFLHRRINYFCNEEKTNSCASLKEGEGAHIRKW